jgi:hypothetical protein
VKEGIRDATCIAELLEQGDAPLEIGGPAHQIALTEAHPSQRVVGPGGGSAIAERPREDERFIEQLPGTPIISLAEGKQTGAVEGTRTRGGEFDAAHLQRNVEPAAPLGQVPAEPPEPAKRGGQAQL